MIMRKILAIALLSLSGLAVAQDDYISSYAQPQDGKTCMDWQNQFTTEVLKLKGDVAALKARLKTDKSLELKTDLKEKQADLKAAQNNLKIAKKAVSSEKAADKAIQKATQLRTKLQQKQDKAQNAIIKAQQKASNAEKKVAAAEHKLEQARQAADKAYNDVEKAKNAVSGLENDGDIAESALKKAQEQKVAAKAMIRENIVVRQDGSSGPKR